MARDGGLTTTIVINRRRDGRTDAYSTVYYAREVSTVLTERRPLYSGTQRVRPIHRAFFYVPRRGTRVSLGFEGASAPVHTTEVVRVNHQR